MAENNFSNIAALFQLQNQLEDIDRVIQLFATEIVDELREKAPKDTQALKKSIKFNATRFGFRLEMLEYGFYQNYGVGPKAKTPYNNKQTGGAPQQPYGVTDPLTFGFYSYSDRKFGLPARPFFNLEDIQNRLVELVEQQIETE